MAKAKKELFAPYWRQGVEDGMIRLRRWKTRPGYWFGKDMYASEWLTRLTGRSSFRDADYDKVLAKLGEHGIGLETPYDDEPQEPVVRPLDPELAREFSETLLAFHQL